MNVAIIVGSHRKKSQSLRVGKFLQQELQEKNHNSNIIELQQLNIGIWDEQVWNNNENWEKVLLQPKSILQQAQSIIVISPEYAGMASPILKNFFLFLSEKEVGHKPALIVSVSAARGGAFPIAELRSSSYKNNSINYIPEHLIFRDIEKLKLNEASDELSIEETYIKERVNYALDVLEDYSLALAEVRKKGRVFSEKFSNGMS